LATYDYAQLEQLWTGAGGPRALAPLMAAIALAESSGNSQARNPSGASGLWQILGDPFPGDPFDPQTNAKMAVAKYREQGLNAWATYTSGAYKRFLRGSLPPGTTGGPPPGGTHTTAAQGGGGGFWTMWNTVPGTGIPIGFIAGAAQSTTDVATAVGQLSNDISTVMGWVSWLFVPNHWIRIISFLLGVPLVGVGIITMTRTGRAYQMTVSVPGAGQQTLPAAGGELAPALGIIEVTLGAVLLFIAFHNLPDSVQNFPQLMSFMQSKVSTGAADKTLPQVAVD
jgi:hypothetical protein